MEIWKDIPGFIGYEASSYGRIRIKGGGFVSQVLTGTPQYWYVNIHPDINNIVRKHRKLKRVHNLVARAFLPNPDNLTRVDHIDKNSYNNNLFNLRWITPAGNQRNRKDNVTFCGELVKDILGRCVQNTSTLPNSVYWHFRAYTKKGYSFQEAIILTLERYKALPTI